MAVMIAVMMAVMMAVVVVVAASWREGGTFTHTTLALLKIQVLSLRKAVAAISALPPPPTLLLLRFCQFPSFRWLACRWLRRRRSHPCLMRLPLALGVAPTPAWCGGAACLLAGSSGCRCPTKGRLRPGSCKLLNRILPCFHPILALGAPRKCWRLFEPH